MDLVVNDKSLLKMLKGKYAEYLMEKDESLNIDVDCADCKKCEKQDCPLRKE